MVVAVPPSLALTLPMLAVLGSVPSPRLVAATEPAASAGSSQGYQEALAAVDEANLAVNKDPEANLAALADAIAELRGHDLALALDPAGREALDLSRLNLARALLLTGAEDRAGEVMDEVLRGAAGRELPVDRFGPTLVAFHERRLAALAAAGTASIQVRCRISCRVILDARPATADSGPLLLGEHRVWIGAAESSSVPVDEHIVELREAGVTTVVEFPSEAQVVAEPVTTPIPSAPPQAPRRILPRWAEIGVTVIGLSAVIAGGVALGFDGKCPGGGDPSDPIRCPQVYESTVPGFLAIGFGSLLTIAGTVTLSIDEDRLADRRGRRATLNWQMRF
jgi:hypothetical protein